MPAIAFAQSARNQRRGDHADIDRDVEDLECHRAAQVAGAVQFADLAGDIALEQADADHQRDQREQERAFYREQEMAERHHHRARDQRRAAAQPAIGDEPASNRGEIDERGVIAENRRAERLARLVIPVVAQPVQPEHAADMVGQQQVFDHVQRQQRLHRIV